MNNYFQECPPLMSDGRWQTDYTSTPVRDHIIASINNIQRDDDYRHFLEMFGQKIRDMQSKNDKAKFPCDTRVCVHDYNSKTTFMTIVKSFEIQQCAINTSKFQMFRISTSFKYC